MTTNDWEYKVVHLVMEKSPKMSPYKMMYETLKILIREMAHIHDVLDGEVSKYKSEPNKLVTAEDIPDKKVFVEKTREAYSRYMRMKSFCKCTGIIFDDIVSIAIGFKKSEEKDLDKYLSGNDVIKSLKLLDRQSKN